MAKSVLIGRGLDDWLFREADDDYPCDLNYQCKECNDTNCPHWSEFNEEIENVECRNNQ